MPDTFLTDMAVADNEILDALGETASVKDAGSVAVGNIVGIFEKQYIEAFDLQGYQPTFTYQDADLVIDEGYELTLDGKLFNVRVKQADGTGIALLILGEK